MATSKGYFARPSYRFLPLLGDTDHSLSLAMDSDSPFEFDEPDIYNSAIANSPEFRKSLSGSRIAKKPSSAKPADSEGGSGAPASLPVNIPDWSKILGVEYRENRRRGGVDDDDDEAESYDGWDGDEKKGGRVPPHEFLARTRIASFSVHEGVGRTLKGRDLSRVRNAIWAKTGFQD